MLSRFPSACSEDISVCACVFSVISRFPSACSEDISVCVCVFRVFLRFLVLVVRISVSVSVYSVCL